MKLLVFIVFWALMGAVSVTAALADDYEQSEQAQVAKHANEFIAKAYGREK